MFQVLQTADRERFLDDINTYLDSNLLPYLADCLPAASSCTNFIVQKVLNHPLQVNIVIEKNINKYIS